MGTSHAKQTRSIGWMRARLHPVPRQANTRWVGATASVLGSVLVHLVLVQAVVLGGGSAAAPTSRHPGLAADAMVGSDEARSTLILIDASGSDRSESEPRESLVSRGARLQSVRLVVITPESMLEPVFSLGDTNTDDEASREESADQLGLVKQFGLYMGQIQARIERAWLRPRSPTEGGAFACRVEILQSRRGEVQEVTLQHCDADTRWQLSLVQAIERASPLPAPPDPVVFSESLQLSFHSSAFTPNGTIEGFEPVAPLPLLTHDVSPAQYR